MTWSSLGTSRIQERRERMQIKLEEGILMLCFHPGAQRWVSHLHSLLCHPESSSAPSTSPSQEQSPGAELKKPSASRAQGTGHQTSESFINNWDETTLRSSPGVRPSLTHTGMGERIHSWGGSTFIPILCSQFTELSRTLPPALVWVRDTPKDSH